MTGAGPRAAFRFEARDAWWAFGATLLVRSAVVLWASARFPPAADGVFYARLAERIAAGEGSTWLWPDGAVTYAAHYPVGYPALLALAYRLFGASQVTAMALNAITGATLPLSVHALLRNVATRRGRFAAALATGLHPALVPYTAAFMTEGLVASLLVGAAALSLWPRARRGRLTAWPLVASGALLGVATLVRPQSIVLAPFIGFFAVATAPGVAALRARGLAAALVTLVALGCCAPWTARNCVRMQSCALVSVNGGWNLLIGTQTENGAWAPVEVPEACRTVWDEAAKDACFGHAAREAIARAPGAWLARAFEKIAVTFDYFGAAPWYLHASNPAAFTERAKTALGVLETVVSRLFLLGALLAVARPIRDGEPTNLRRVRRGLCGVGALFAVTVHGVFGYLLLAVALVARGRRATLEGAPLLPWTAAIIAATAALHAVFFGAGRYGLVVVPFVTALAFVSPARPSEPPPGEAERVA